MTENSTATETIEREAAELDLTFGVSDEELTRRFCEAVRLENEAKKIAGCPVTCYDDNLKKPYIEYADGKREYAEKT